MIKFQIDWIYFIIPSLLLIISGFRLKKSIIFFLSLFILIFISFSYNGADYKSYKLIYEAILSGVDLNKVHGEYIFKIYMKISQNIGLNYEVFKIIHSLIFIGIMFYSIAKLSDNCILSLYIVYTSYTLYLFSAYRQLSVMSLFFYEIYLYSSGRKKMAIFISIIGSLLHISGVWVVLFFLFLWQRKSIKLTKIKVLIFIFLSFIFRIFLISNSSILLIISELVGRKEHLEYYLESSNYMNIGILSRIVMVLIILIFSKRCQNKLMNKIIDFFIISMIMNIVLPVEAIAGRLFNNGRILEVLIIPYIYKNLYKYNRLIFKWIIIIYYLIIFIAQLVRQIGYYPYSNLLFN